MTISVGQVAVASDVNVALGLRSQYAWGTYSGNGTASRQITTGFLCGQVAIEPAANNRLWICKTVSGSLFFNADTSSIALATNVLLHATNGFTVASTANSSTDSYSYMAFSRE